MKVSGGFRSESECDNYCDTFSIINTVKKRGIDVFKTIESVFNNKNIFTCYYVESHITKSST